MLINIQLQQNPIRLQANAAATAEKKIHNSGSIKMHQVLEDGMVK